MSAARSILLTLAATAAIAMSGCAVKKDFYAMGGSRADGTVDMAYDFKQFETPVVNRDQAMAIAKQKCGVWGYNNAEPFGGQTQNCYARDGFGQCVAGQVVVKYQCIGAATALSSLSAPTPVQTSAVPLTKEAYKQKQLQMLEQQGLPYDQYMKRYNEIMAQ